MRISLFLLIGNLLLACSDDTYDDAIRCDVEIQNIEPAELIPNEIARIEAYPLSTVWDSLVELNDTELIVESVEKENCESCEECRTANDCTTCDYCSSCLEECQECVHSLEVFIPEDLPSNSLLTITNSYGSSDPISVSIATTEQK